MLFHEITKDAVQRALANAGQIDEKKVEAQQARRVLDRLVGYKASPILWKTVKKGISAGSRADRGASAHRRARARDSRVQAGRVLDHRGAAGEERAALHRPSCTTSTARSRRSGRRRTPARSSRKSSAWRRLSPRREREAGNGELIGAFPVTEVKRRERRKNPSPPFTTSTLQQEAAKKLGFGSKRTMRLAQDLYEGIDIGPEGAVGLITYMRTDSTRVAESAALQARDHLRTLFGAEYLASSPMFYGGGKNAQNAQDAHEGIRPTDPARRPDLVRRYLKEDQFKLYQLIWQRFMASQMAPAVFDTTTVDYDLAQAGVARQDDARVSVPVHRQRDQVPGLPRAVSRGARGRRAPRARGRAGAARPLEKGERVPVREVVPSQHFTEPPPRFSEASLVKELERLGIGRPSTYAQIISTLVDRHYTQLEQRRFFPTALGESVERVMVKQFPDIFNVGFTSGMEGELDKIEDGAMPWRRVLSEFYGPFEKSLNSVQVESLIAEAHDLSGARDRAMPELRRAS